MSMLMPINEKEESLQTEIAFIFSHINTTQYTYGREYDFSPMIKKFDFDEIAEELLTEVNHALKDRHMTSQLQ